MRITFIGLGQMGAGLARLLLGRGYQLTVWNRTAAAAEALLGDGAATTATPSEAVANAELVFTMVHDDAALEDILFQRGVLTAMPKGAIHVSLSTISPAFSDRIFREHQAHDQHYVASPVFGRPAVAAEGKLWLAIAGAEQIIQQVLPVLDTFCRGYTIIGNEPSAANVVKIAGNFLITAMIASLSEGLVVAEAHRIDPALFLETINHALFQSPFYAAYSKVMLDPPDKVAATMELGAKDTRLFREAARQTASRTPLADIFQQQFELAKEEGLGGADWAAGYLRHTRENNQSHAVK